jgi:hypothetical protein
MGIDRHRSRRRGLVIGSAENPLVRTVGHERKLEAQPVGHAQVLLADRVRAVAVEERSDRRAASWVELSAENRLDSSSIERILIES